MIRYKLTFLTTLPVVVSLDANHPDQSARLKYEGQEDAVGMIQSAVSGGSGISGHVIGEQTTPADLAAAMESGSLRQYKPELLEGREIIDRFERKAPPPGSVD